MSERHILSIYHDEATLRNLGWKGQIHAHELGEVLKQVPESLEHPLMVIPSETHPDTSVVVITEVKTPEGSLVVPIALDGNIKADGGRIDAHIATSAQGRKP